MGGKGRLTCKGLLGRSMQLEKQPWARKTSPRLAGSPNPLKATQRTGLASGTKPRSIAALAGRSGAASARAGRAQQAPTGTFRGAARPSVRPAPPAFPAQGRRRPSSFGGGQPGRPPPRNCRAPSGRRTGGQAGEAAAEAAVAARSLASLQRRLAKEAPAVLLRARLLAGASFGPGRAGRSWAAAAAFPAWSAPLDPRPECGDGWTEEAPAKKRRRRGRPLSPPRSREGSGSCWRTRKRTLQSRGVPQLLLLFPKFGGGGKKRGGGDLRASFRLLLARSGFPLKLPPPGDGSEG